MKRGQIGEQIKKLAEDSRSGLSVNQLRVVIALERAVARLEGESRLHGHLVFKGGFVLFKMIESSRFTRDLDAVAFDIDQEEVARLAKKALERDLGDELWFLDVASEAIPDQGEYGGMRLNAAFHIGVAPPDPAKIKKLSRVHVDIGFGDVVPMTARASGAGMPSLTGGSPISWHIYPLEFIFAEKLQTLLERGSANSRAKDVYDLVEIFPRCLDEDRLRQAVTSVFGNRRTSLPSSLTDAVRRIDTAILERSWVSIDIATGMPEFKDYWDRLLRLLIQIDRQIRAQPGEGKSRRAGRLLYKSK